MAQGYFSPTLLDEAMHLVRTRDLAIVAGGTDVYPSGGLRPGADGVLDLSRIEEMAGLDRLEDGSLRLGGAVTWSEVASASLPAAFDGLRAAARQVGGVQIQNAGTLAGNICNASPAADGVPPLLTLGAEVELASPGGQRVLPLEDFILGVRKTALRPGEIVMAIRIPPPPPAASSAFGKLGARRYLVISIVMTAVLVNLDAAGRIAEARVAVGACSPVARRLTALEADLRGCAVGEIRVTDAHLAGLAPISDIRADAAYRAEAVRHQIERTLKEAIARHG